MEKILQLQKELAAAEEGSREWGFLQMQLGDAFHDVEEPPETEESAISAYQSAMEVYTLERSPLEWAQLAIRLSDVYLFRKLGIGSQNIENAIWLSQKASLLLTPKSEFIENLMEAQINIATGFLNLLTGDRSENIETAIRIFNSILPTITEFSKRWAEVQNQIGVAFLYRIGGERAKNLEIAFGSFTTVLNIFTLESYPVKWAQAQSNLATVYLQRISGERHDNLEKAIVIYESIQQVFTRQRFPVGWAKTKANLSDTYRNRILGDRSKNLEEAIDACMGALQVFTKEQFPLDWARNNIHLGNIYMVRMVGVRIQNLENALSAYYQAFIVYKDNKLEYPIEWGYVHISLGTAYRARLAGDPAENSQKAIDSYKAALEIFLPEKYWELWGQTQNNLGNAYMDSSAGDFIENLDNGILAFKAALQVFEMEKYPVDWARIQNNLGIAYMRRQTGESFYTHQKAIEAFVASLQIRTFEKFPAEYIRTIRAMGEAYYKIGNWTEALECLMAAINAADSMRHSATNVVTHERMSEDMAETFRMAIHAALAVGHIEDAASLTIASKGRTLAGRMNAIEMADIQLMYSEPELVSAMKILAELENKIKWDDYPAEELVKLRARRKEIIDRIAIDYPALITVRSFEAVTLEEIWEAIAVLNDIPVLDFVKHEGGWGAFLYIGKKIKYIELDKWLSENIGIITDQIQQEEFWDRNDYLLKLCECYEVVFSKIRPQLPANGQLIICPTGVLNQLPFQVLRDKQDNYLCGTYAISFIYSLSMLPVLLRNRQLNHSKANARLLNIAHPGRKGTPNYIGESVLAEMKAVAACFPKREDIIQLFESEARPEAVMEKANSGSWDVIHINCHGAYDSNDPIRSGLKLHGRTLTIQDILLRVRLRGNPLVTLSACQTGQMQAEIADENVSLVSAFLIAGASATLSSLWSVPAATTKLLMGFFYTIRNEGNRTDAEVLQIAMNKVRSMEGYKNPCYWAAFQLIGLSII